MLSLMVSCDTKVNNTSSCGDGIQDPGEDCDGSELSVPDCQALGYYEQFGVLQCKADCTFDLSVCSMRCGDGTTQIDKGEECDGYDLDGQTCQTKGYHEGNLSCTECEFDLTDCEASGKCDDGVIDAAFESCDGANLDSQTCMSLGYYDGILACQNDCAAFDESGCIGRCGDGDVWVEDGEECDDGNIDDEDGCLSTCLRSPGWTCYSSPGQPSTCIQVIGISGGLYHSCAVLADGTIRCWGRNNFGQLGDGTNTDALRPVEVSGISGAVSVDCGWQHTCAVLSDGTVKCWGENTTGQLGDGTTNHSLLPISVPGLTQVVQVSLGAAHTCALSSDGTAKCWGINNVGQLGSTSIDLTLCTIGATPYNCSRSPIDVTGLTGATALEVGGAHACALVSGQVKCWGENLHGALGNGNNTNSFSPVFVKEPGGANLAGITAIGSGWGHSCASSGQLVRCWGRNDSYQLGDGTQTSRNFASAGLSLQAGSVSLGHQFSCAVLSSGISCWGANNVGQIGTGLAGSSISVPTPVTNVLTINGIGSGSNGSCIIKTSGDTFCWGDNLYGQIGNNSTTTSAAPVPVMW